MSAPAHTPAFVILGGDETGLAVARNAATRGVRPVVLARRRDIATRSRLADCVAVDEPGAERTLDILLGFGSPATRPPLVATNDRWLRFILDYRAALEKRFTILHPSNQVLEICLNKRRFADWCSARGIPTPALVDALGKSVSFPVMLRPEWSNQAPPDRVPKASPVRDAEELRATIDMFEAASSPWVATRSLVDEAREQYSVAVAVSGSSWLSFVAQKLRPLPDRCAVGTCVALRPHAGVESLARTLLHTMGFDSGMAEVEIISTATGELLVIEVNPRPWSQFALSYRSGHDFLGFLLDPGWAPPPDRRREGLAWIAFGNDLFTCFSRSSGLVRHRRLTVTDYLRSLGRARVFARFSFSDPWPALHGLIGTATEGTRPRDDLDPIERRIIHTGERP